jgi:hypothetical protein
MPVTYRRLIRNGTISNGRDTIRDQQYGRLLGDLRL